MRLAVWTVALALAVLNANGGEQHLKGIGLSGD